MNNKKGNILVSTLSVLAILGIIAAGYFFWQNNNIDRIAPPANTPLPPSDVPLTWEECIKYPAATITQSYPGTCHLPDGRAVTQPLSEEEKEKTQPPDETVNWKTYTSVFLGVSFKYPYEWNLKESSYGVGFEIEPDPRTVVGACPGYVLSVTTKLDPNETQKAFLPVLASILDNQPVELFEKTDEYGCLTKRIYVNKFPKEGYTPKLVISLGGKKPRVILDQILATFKFLDQNDVNETFTIDFSACPAGRKSVTVAFGSTTYEVTGKKLDACEINYGGEVENPNWDGRLDTNCLVPTSLGKIAFKTNQYGVDFSPIKNYCSAKK